MKIVQITPGIITIPPNGWGAIEKVIWNYKNFLESEGHICDIKYLEEIKPGEYDIVHIHVANLAIEAKEMGIPYIFSLHDHHVYRYGKDSEVYKQNIEAIKGSIISFTHAEFLVEYFEDADKLFYLSHGVDVNFFKPKLNYSTEKKEFSLLCVANNGYSDDKSYDRKGFRYAIEAAKSLDMPITIVGPENNMNFFNKNKDLLEYKKLNLILENVSEDKLLKIYRSHDIFLHPSELEAGHPNLTLLEAISCSMPVVGTYDGSNILDSLVMCSTNSKSVADGIVKVVNNYDYYYQKTHSDTEKFSWSVICSRLAKMYKSTTIIKEDCTDSTIKSKYIQAFSNLEKNNNNKIERREMFRFDISYINGVTVNVIGNSTKIFDVQFWNGDVIEFSTKIGVGQWCKPNVQYFKNWDIKIYSDGEMVYNKKLDFSNKRIYIAIDSSSLGDNIAWMPYIEEFRNKHNCSIITSTFFNELFKNNYPDIEFIEPGETADNIYGMYTIGCFHNSNLEPEPYNKIPLQKVATNILGLEFKEIKCNVGETEVLPMYLTKKYIAIAPHSTAGLKYWNNPTGWGEVVEFLNSDGYEVINVSREGCSIPGVKNLNDYCLGTIMSCIKGAEFFIGLSSGLSWLAWAMNKDVILISNFTDKNHEFNIKCTRVYNESVCHNCWSQHIFDKNDWNWCPIKKGTDGQFECSKSITGGVVIDKIKNLTSK